MICQKIVKFYGHHGKIKRFYTGGNSLIKTGINAVNISYLEFLCICFLDFVIYGIHSYRSFNVDGIEVTLCRCRMD